jgi:hypothetical protein
MRRRETEIAPILGVVEVKLPDSLSTALNAFARREAVGVDAAVGFVIDLLTGLSREDISELQDPPKEKINRVCEWRVGRTRKVMIESFPAEYGYSYSTVLRRTLYAFLVSKEIALTKFKLQRTQMHFSFAENYERDKSDISASRQHWEAL